MKILIQGYKVETVTKSNGIKQVSGRQIPLPIELSSQNDLWNFDYLSISIDGVDYIADLDDLLSALIGFNDLKNGHESIKYVIKPL